MRLSRLGLSLLAALIFTPAAAQSTVSRGSGITVDAAADGRLVIDLRGDIWIVSSGGGDATQVTEDLRTARRPRWSANGQRIVYEAVVDNEQGLWVYDVSTGASTSISETPHPDLYPAWHPGGERIVYASDRAGSGFDLWETDLATGLHWRTSGRRGDETEPAWSADGRDLVYVHRHQRRWSLVLRRFGRPEEILFSSNERISAPSWRPDGSLITFFHNGATGTALNMVILSQPRIVRIYDDRESISPAPIGWLDRQRMVYVARGFIRERDFDAWSSRQVPFTATIQPDPQPVVDRPRPELEWPGEPTGKLVVRAARLFDGVGFDYQVDKDIVIEGGRIAAVTDPRNRGDAIVVDLGDVAVIPGFIDADARLPSALSPAHGPDLLTMGVTTIVADFSDAQRLNTLWADKSTPGPRLLSGPEWTIGPQSRPEFDATAAVSTSRSTGRTAGTSLPTQFRTLDTAGLSPVQILRAVGANAAAALLADPYLGRIAPGAAADLLFVDGDPLVDVNDALNIVAVVRNGRLYSVSGLVDRTKSAEGVE